MPRTRIQLAAGVEIPNGRLLKHLLQHSRLTGGHGPELFAAVAPRHEPKIMHRMKSMRPVDGAEQPADVSH